ncbi:SIMPL domain-containing protein [Luteimonas sp. RD2P54]|uniref:SIMPL domain-containing protein n=1 Tax=Luteimonas endophytica TaxID=3042023 RepID=A0ABT6J988_9GAMM|nr:SIMPL domain-containing protein [Luteimonas endophytica]MDH5823382.1 SIMPL domain-containing protein [Luteimonas endophytica]
MRQSLLPLLLAAALAAPTAAAQAPAVPQAAASDGTLLSISAQAEASRVPDVATLSAGVVTQAPDANAALRANAAQMQQLMAAVREAGIADKDTQTSGLSVHPQYRHDGDSAPVITGYQASNTVSLKVRDIGSLGDVLDALVASGANQVNGPSFEIDQPDEAYDEARRGALAKARERAEMYAESLGLRVRRIVSISEGGGFMPPPMPMMRMRAEAQDMAASSPVSPGESTLTANLDVVFELGR